MLPTEQDPFYRGTLTVQFCKWKSLTSRSMKFSLDEGEKQGACHDPSSFSSHNWTVPTFATLSSPTGDGAAIT